MRCNARTVTSGAAQLRCDLQTGHDGKHFATEGAISMRWDDWAR